MSTSMKILIVEDNPGDARLLLEQLKEEGQDGFRLHWADKMQSALELVDKHATDLAPMPFDVVLLDLNLGDSHGLETFVRLHEKIPQVPVVLLTGLEDEATGLRAVQIGAQDYLVKGHASGAAIARALRFAVERNRSLQWHRSKSRHSAGGRSIAFLGVKGGVGATTLALNAAAVLAQDRLVCAVEFTTGFGHFAAHFHNLAGPSMPELFGLPQPALDAATVERYLVNSQLGFYMLLGPAVFDRQHSPSAERAAQLLDLLESMVDYTVIDLPAAWSAAHPAILRKAHSVVLVCERNDLSIDAAQLVVEQVRKLGVTQEAVQLAVVNKSPSQDGPNNEKIERMVGIPLAGSVAPAADICLAAHRAGVPVAVFRPHSAPAGTMASIAHAAAAVANPAPLQVA